MAGVEWSDRLRISMILFIIALWLFIIDGLNYIINFDEGLDASKWAVYFMIVLGLTYGIVGMAVAICLFVWYEPKNCGIILSVLSVVCGALRLVCVIFGFKDFAEEQYLNSTTNATTDVAIACFQLYMVIEGIFILRNWDKMGQFTYTAVEPAQELQDA